MAWRIASLALFPQVCLTFLGNTGFSLNSFLALGLRSMARVAQAFAEKQQ
jgi:hypothetical protein